MMQFVSVSLLPVNIRIAPPSEELFLPLVRARSEIETVPRPKLNKKVVAFPLMTKALAPGPLMLMALDSGTLSGPLVRIIVPVTLNWIVSPSCAIASALRNEPGPVSLVLVTVIVAA